MKNYSVKRVNISF